MLFARPTPTAGEPPPPDVKARTIIAAGVAAALLLLFVQRFLLIELLLRRIGQPLLLALVIAIAIFGVGGAIRGGRRDPATDFLVGYPLFGALSFLLGLVRIQTTTMVLAIAIGLALLFLAWRRPLRDRSPETAPDVSGLTLVVVVTMLAVVILTGFIVAQAPPVSLDEVSYHLAVPRAWTLEGRSVELPLISHSYFPLGIESADLPALTLLGTDGALTSHFLHLIACIATIALLLRRSRSWLATAAIACAPALSVTAGWSLLEWPLIGICLALDGAREEDDRSFAAATAAGLLTKYTFIPIVLAAAFFSRRWKGAAVGAIGGALFFVRNLVLTGNPVAPFFGADAPHVASYREGILGYLFDGTFADESLGASLIALASGASLGFPLAMSAAAIALLFLHPSSRILLPYLALGAVHGTAVLRSGLVRLLIVIAILAQTFLIVWFTDRGDAFALMAGRLDDTEYVRRGRPLFADIVKVNSVLPAESKTLIVNLNETFWFSRPVRGAGNFDGQRMSRYLEPRGAESLSARLKSDGITHVAIFASAVPTRDAKKRQERETSLTPAAQKNLADVLDRETKHVRQLGNAVVFTLK